METPVLIVGGGPVGLALALELGWRGVECTLIEQSDGSIPTPKMQEVNTRTMEFCRRWGIADQVMRCPFPDDLPMDVVVITRLGAPELGRIERPARRLQRPGPHSPVNLQVCSQQWFDPMLRARAESFPGVRLLYRHRLETFEADGEGVTATVADASSGRSKTVRARYLVGADGASSAVRRKLGIGLEGSPVLSHSMHLFFRVPDLFGKLGIDKPGTFYSAVDKEGLWGNLRVIDPNAGEWRILIDVDEATTPDDIDKEAVLCRVLARPVDVKWLGMSKWTRRGVVAERFREGRVFLVGDAVHQVSPTGALGMNTGIADAVDLGWKLAATLEGWGGPRLLDSYDAERRPASARNVRMATQFYENQARFHDLDAIEDDSAQGRAARERVGAEIVKQVTRTFSTLGLQIGIRYENSPVCIADGTPEPPDSAAEYIPTARPGARAPHVPLADGRSTLDLFGRGFVLMVLGSKDDAPGVGALESAARAKRVPLEVVRLRGREVDDTYEMTFVLVRPDGHVAWRADAIPKDVDTLIDRVRGA